LSRTDIGFSPLSTVKVRFWKKGRTGRSFSQPEQEPKRAAFVAVKVAGLQEVSVAPTTVPGLADALHRPDGAQRRLKSE